MSSPESPLVSGGSAWKTKGGFTVSLDNLVFNAPQNTSPTPASASVTLVEDATPDSTRSGIAPEPSKASPPEPDGRPMLLPIMVLVAILLGPFGCAKPPEHPWVVRDGLVEVETYNRGQLFVKREHHLGDYDNLLIDHVGFRYRRGQERLKEGEEDRIVSMLLGAVQGSQDGTIGLAAVAGPCVLTVNFFLKDLEIETPDWDGRSQTNFMSSYGAATMVLELRDSMDQEPLARFIQRRDLGGGRVTQTQSKSLQRLRYVMSFALRDMGNQLRKVIPPTTGHSNTKCRGGMSQVALGSR